MDKQAWSDANHKLLKAQGDAFVKLMDMGLNEQQASAVVIALQDPEANEITNLIQQAHATRSIGTVEP